ncbi:MAG: sugar phosphate isomerase/epimerase [Acidobacteria bacterium]|nr:sugar phosphate isomerase/epimerase [Acidobacteriota bacterium]
MPSSSRRSFFAHSAALAAATAFPAEAKVNRAAGVKLKLGLNAYSFDKPLRDGRMTLHDAIQFCAKHGVDGLDATGYYFPGYPNVPSDEYIYNLKRAGFVNGVAISGTGVRNEFAVADRAARAKDVQLVKDWIVVASKLGAPVIRVFSGRTRPKDHSFENAFRWMVADMKECAAFGKQHGVVVAVQQHDDFLKTADETIRLIDSVGSEWFGCILDIGSLRQSDPYTEIEKLVPFAVSWQIKEKVGRNGVEEAVDLAKLKAVIDRSGYRGYIPFEALGPGDPAEKVVNFLNRIRKAFSL